MALLVPIIVFRCRHSIMQVLISRLSLKDDNKNVVKQMKCSELQWRAVVSGKAAVHRCGLSRVVCTYSNPLNVGSGLHGCNSILAGCWRVFWTWSLIAAKYYDRWDHEVWHLCGLDCAAGGFEWCILGTWEVVWDLGCRYCEWSFVMFSCAVAMDLKNVLC